MSGSDPFALALRLLTRREHSRSELAAKLRGKGFTEAAVSATLDRCLELGYLDDSRFALSRARSLLESGRAVVPRLARDLQRFGIDPATAAAAIAEAQEGRSEGELLAAQIARRFPAFVWTEADDRQRRRVVHFFLRRGYPLALVLAFLKQER